MFFSPFERMMSWRYLRARRKEGFVSVITGFSLLGICLGVATLIIVMSVMNGFREELLTRILGLNGHIAAHAIGGQSVYQYDKLSQHLASVKGITKVIPTIEGQVMFSNQGQSTGGLVRGIHLKDLAQREIFKKNWQGAPVEEIGDNTVIVGEKLANHLGLMLGDEITIISAKGNVTAFGTIPRVRSYKIGAMFNVGMYEYDSSFVFMPLETAQVYFNMPEAVSHVEIFTENPDRVDLYLDHIIEKVKQPLKFYTWQDSNASFFNAIQVERNVMFLILTLIILVAAFNIISGLIMLVKDKGRDIAVLRTMGATKNNIMKIFFMAGAAIGVVGTTAGLTLGLLFCHYIETIRRVLQSLTGTELFSEEIYFLSHLPAIINPCEVVMVTCMSLILSFGATIYPAYRASKLDPVEALRYE